GQTVPPYDFVSLKHPVIQQFGWTVAPSPIAGSSVNTQNNPNFNYGNQRPYVFDTWSALKDDLVDYSSWQAPGTAFSVPLYQHVIGSATPAGAINQATNPPSQYQYIRILAVQVTIRIWDNNTRQVRQSSIVVDQ